MYVLFKISFFLKVPIRENVRFWFTIQDLLKQWYAGKCLTASYPKKRPCFLAFADFCGVNTPATAI